MITLKKGDMVQLVDTTDLPQYILDRVPTDKYHQVRRVSRNGAAILLKGVSLGTARCSDKNTVSTERALPSDRFELIKR